MDWTGLDWTGLDWTGLYVIRMNVGVCTGNGFTTVQVQYCIPFSLLTLDDNTILVPSTPNIYVETLHLRPGLVRALLSEAAREALQAGRVHLLDLKSKTDLARGNEWDRMVGSLTQRYIGVRMTPSGVRHVQGRLLCDGQRVAATELKNADWLSAVRVFGHSDPGTMRSFYCLE